MKIIISPAKIMKLDVVGVEEKSTPRFLNEALELWNYLKTLDDKSLNKVWECNNEILNENKVRLARYDLKSNLTPALLLFDGLQYKRMAANVFDSSDWEFINDHLLILDALYGVLRPLDGINPYRLMMLSKINFQGYKSLYDYWGDKLYSYLVGQDHEILNLASKEFSDVITPYLKKEDKFITCTFLSQNKKGELIAKSTEAKSCRGAMVRYIATNKINNFKAIKDFKDYNYAYDEKLSKEDEFVFVKQQKS